eukprot:gene14259-17868_t
MITLLLLGSLLKGRGSGPGWELKWGFGEVTPTPRHAAGAVVIGNTAYILGGFTTPASVNVSSVDYSEEGTIPTVNTFESYAMQTDSQCDSRSSSCGDGAIAENNNNFPGKWMVNLAPVPGLPVARRAVAVHNETVYAVGGQYKWIPSTVSDKWGGQEEMLTDESFTYNVLEGAWSATLLPKITPSRRMTEGFQFQTGARMGSSAAICGTPPRLYVSGGEVFNKSDSVPYGMKFDIIGSLQSIDIARLGHQPVPQWLDHPDMLYPRRDHTLSCYQDKLFAVGGRSTPTYWSDPKNFHTVENNVAMPYVEMYQTNPHPLLQKDTPWKQITSNRVPRSGHSALVIGSTLLMMGGEGVWQSSVATVETLDLSDSTFPWSLQQPMLSARAFHAGVWFPTV